MTGNTPRLVIAGSSGDSGKTTVALGLLAAWRERGLSPVAFKKGPDFIDAAWLGWAGGCVGRNLDTYLMSEQSIRRSLLRHAFGRDVAVIEGNRGLLDGMDAEGTHSTATMAKILESPVILVLPVTKMTRSAAATLVGMRQLEPDVQLAGVVINRVAGPRHESICRKSIEQLTGIPVLGAIPKIKTPLLADRHLGLVPPAESDCLPELYQRLVDIAENNLDVEKIFEIAQSASMPRPVSLDNLRPAQTNVRIGIIRDSAFTFYYTENLEALEQAGATLVSISSIDDAKLPDNIDALYIGGGFPETHAEKISANKSFLGSLWQAARSGLPIYAECGGLMLLAQSLNWQGKNYPLAGVFDFQIDIGTRPAASHGYMKVTVDQPNPFYPIGLELMGHEFHYSKVNAAAGQLQTAFTVNRGGGCFPGRDGLVTRNVLASYLHVHALGVPQWANGMIRAALEHSQNRGMGEEEKVLYQQGEHPCATSRLG